MYVVKHINLMSQHCYSATSVRINIPKTQCYYLVISFTVNDWLTFALDSFITKPGHPKIYSKYSGISDQIYEERVGMVRSAVYPIIRSIKPPSYIVLSGFVALASDPKPRYGRYFARSGLNHHKLFNLQEQIYSPLQQVSSSVCRLRRHITITSTLLC